MNRIGNWEERRDSKISENDRAFCGVRSCAEAPKNLAPLLGEVGVGDPLLVIFFR
jgi:hypothetical protein